MFASGENLSDQHLPELIKLSFPPLLQVISENQQRYNLKVKSRAVQVVESCLDWLALIKQTTGPTAIKTLSGMLTTWIDTFVNFLSQPDQMTSYRGLKISMLRVSFQFFNLTMLGNC